jgi:hypothetical protein
MSDFINGLGARGPSAYGLGAPRTAGATGAAGEAPKGGAQAEAAETTEGFSPTSEAGESNQDTQAGVARASQIFSAWAPTAAAATPSAGQLDIQGGENTSVNQVHGVQNGQHVGSQGPDAGFSQATVYSSKPPS